MDSCTLKSANKDKMGRGGRKGARPSQLGWLLFNNDALCLPSAACGCRWQLDQTVDNMPKMMQCSQCWRAGGLAGATDLPELR